MTTTGELALDTADDAASVLALARSRRAEADRAEADLMVAAARWVELHASGASVSELDWHEGSIPLAGPGAPEVPEFCIAEFALAVGLTPDGGARFLGESVELHHRLGRLWERVQSDDLRPWRARRVAQATISLPADGAAYVDRHVASVAHRIGVAALDRLVEEARIRFDPEAAELRALDAAESRHATVHLGEVDMAGVVAVSAALDLPAAVDLEEALRAGADRLARDGSPESLDVRRSQALGLLARGELTLDDAAPGPAASPAGRRIVLHLHASTDPASPLVRVEQTRALVMIDRLAEWCLDPATQLDVRPVLDLAGHVHVEAYEVPDRLAEQVDLRDVSCAFPRCPRRARRCDHDHVVAFHRGGATCSCNLAPLCRSHHRLKTFGDWTYVVLEPGSYLWTSPHGDLYLRDHRGTLDLTRRRPPPTGCADPDPPPDP